MGSPDDDDQALGDEKPPHRVKIGYRFAVGRYPVTFEEYDQFCADTGREKPEDEGWGRERRPAVNVSWDDAQAYVKWLRGETGRRYRLPTEAEWEYACRARSTTCYCFGDDESQLGEYAWYSGNSDGQTHPVGEKQANGFGLHDMHGNVWEWVEDVWHEDYSGNPPDDGSAWVQDGYDDCRVLRGGSRFDLSRILRSANRDGYVTVSRLNDVGFRVARTLS
jgi:formylglycine-generating enzyme required for sulfatase activity